MICSKNNNVLIDFNDAVVVDYEGKFIYIQAQKLY
jgi:hypothetical protein